jgi:23S rRNA (guanosine2251-2'-O)-methyltransferase
MEELNSRREPKKSTIIIGRQPVIEAMENGHAIDKILFQQNVSGESIGRIRKLAQERAIPIQQVPVEKLNSYSRSNHQGCIALAAIVEYMNLQQVIDLVVGNGEVPLFVMLDGVTDVRNIGGIARTAICCGAQAIIVPDKGIAALNEDAMKASAGALEKINICRVNSLLKAVDEMHMNGIQVYTSEMKATATLLDIDFKQPCCIVFGNEEKGVQPYINKAADAQFNIPMKGNFDSFNVSVATGITLFEAMKQRF